MRRFLLHTAQSLVAFQLTHSRGVRPANTSSLGGATVFQLTHSRGVRPSSDWYRHLSVISTHALTWSATIDFMERCVRLTISTHALTWSATPKMRQLNNCRNFNSRTHVECDFRCFQFYVFTLYFNSRTHVECDITLHSQSQTSPGFQLTHSRGVRRRMQAGRIASIISTHALTWSATLQAVLDELKEAISTHALTWSATGGKYHPSSYC